MAKLGIGGIRKMLNSPLASATIITSLARFVPGLGPFVTGAYAAGQTADQIISFLKEQAMSPNERREHSRLSARSEQGLGRPDEGARL